MVQTCSKLDEVTALLCVLMTPVHNTAVASQHSCPSCCQALLLTAPPAAIDAVLVYSHPAGRALGNEFSTEGALATAWDSNQDDDDWLGTSSN